MTKEIPIEVKKAVFLVGKCQKLKPNHNFCPTSYNMQEQAVTQPTPATIAKFCAAAQNRGFIKQEHWYLGSATWTLTISGEMLFSELELEDFRV